MYLAAAKIDLHDAAAVWRRNLRVYLRLWKTELVAPIIEPIFTFFAFGFGVGSLVTSQINGMSYLSFVGAGVLAFTVLMRAVFEMTYGAYFRMVYQSTYDAILATPVNAESLAFGEILWAVTKSVFDSLFILPLVVVFGSATSPLTPLALLPLTLGCFFLASLALNFNRARIRNRPFQHLFRRVLLDDFSVRRMVSRRTPSRFASISGLRSADDLDY